MFKKKNKFITRGLYFINKGEHKGCFLLNMKELDTPTAKALVLYPEGNRVEMATDEITQGFKDNYFEYVHTVKKKYYEVCLAQHAQGDSSS